MGKIVPLRTDTVWNTFDAVMKHLEADETVQTAYNDPTVDLRFRRMVGKASEMMIALTTEMATQYTKLYGNGKYQPPTL